MTREPWQAPRIAYLLTAAAAESDAAACEQIWAGLDDRGEAGVLTALGAQLRAAAHRARQHGRAWNEFDLSRISDEICREAMRGLSALATGGSWEPPPCPHCRWHMAGALAEMISAICRARLGMSPELIAHSCRLAAGQAAMA